MPIRGWHLCTLALLGLALGAPALAARDAEETAPLSAIDWLSVNAPDLIDPPEAETGLAEPPVTRTGRVPDVTVAPLGHDARRRLGLLPQEVTGLPAALWTGSDPAALRTTLALAQSQRIPAAQELLLTLLLAEADDLPTPAAARDWLAARVDGLIHLGAVEPALALVEQAGAHTDKMLFAQWMSLSLHAKREFTPCEVLVANPDLQPNEKTRVFCTAQAGDYDTAVLIFGTAAALDLFSETDEALLGRFLDPELFEEDPVPTPPLRPDALTFRLFEAAGEPLPTAPLPRAFAHSDLSEDAGWKAQIEAAERLARAGVLPSNQLLGLYTARRAAASGGVWDRVAALQAFEEALDIGGTARIEAALPALWRGMRAGALEVVFADLFAAQLQAFPLSGEAHDIAQKMLLLSRHFATIETAQNDPRRIRYLASIAAGTPEGALAQTELETRIALAFSPKPVPSPQIAQTTEDTLGSALLSVLIKLSEAGRGDPAALSRALTDLRSLGLEETARRVALQVLILDQRG